MTDLSKKQDAAGLLQIDKDAQGILRVTLNDPARRKIPWASLSICNRPAASCFLEKSVTLPPHRLFNSKMAAKTTEKSRCSNDPYSVCFKAAFKPAHTRRNNQNNHQIFKYQNRVDFQWSIFGNDQFIRAAGKFLHADHRYQ